MSKPFQNKIPDSTPESLTEFHLLKIETDKLLQKGAIEQVESLEPGSFVSRLFTVPKSNGQRRPVINLRQLNKHVYNQKFHMESLVNIRSLLKQGGFMIKIDLQDAYMSVLVAPKSRSRCLLVFIFDGKIFRFKVIPFSLNSAPRIFTKLFKPILILLRSQGMLLIIYLDDILPIAPTADLCLAQGKFLMKLLQDLGFLVNKSVLTPTQRIIFLGFLTDSVNMTISLPEEKQLAIIQKASSLLGQNLVSIRNLSQFVGMCSATRPALRQAPLFYRKIQLSINKVLSKTGLNKKLCYNQKIQLDFQVRQNLEWWAVEMPHHCTAPVISPPVDVKIATDSPFLGWGATVGNARIAGLWEWKRLWSHINKKNCRPVSLLWNILFPIQAISGENFSQSEYVAFGAISQFAFPPLAKAIHRAFDYVNLSNLCSKQAFHSINLSNVGFIIESQPVRIHISFWQKPINKLRFEAENSTDPYAFARID